MRWRGVYTVAYRYPLIGEVEVVSAPGCWRCRYCQQAFGGPASRTEHEIEHQRARRGEIKWFYEPIYEFVKEGHTIEKAAAVFGCSFDTVVYACTLWGAK